MLKRNSKVPVEQRYDPKPEDIPSTPEGRLDLVEQIRRAVSQDLYGGYPERMEKKIRVTKAGSAMPEG